jgi:hypothetical protein
MPSKPKNTSSKSGALKSTAARANGAKSRGPATPEGRARSSRNSLRHGLAAPSANLPSVSVVLPTESREDFQILLNSHLAQFHPAPGVEAELVHMMAAVHWRLRRLQTIETTLLGNEIVRRASHIASEFEEMDQDPSADDRLAYVFKRLADGGQSLALLVRYEGALNRSYDRAFKQLQMLQSTRTRPRPNDAQPNEPRPPATRSDRPPSVSIREPPNALPAPSCDNEVSPRPSCPTPLSAISPSSRT